jgi:penicillin-binding protein 1B
MQLARGFFLTPEKRLKRKMIEIMITFQLESRFSKQQIFEMYGNQINLGHRGSYDINGFGEASQAFFGKDLKQLNTAEDALLAGMIQSPSRLNPYRHPERALARRNVVLDSMVETGAISPSEATRAKAEPLRLSAPTVDASEAPYFVDLVHDQLVQRINDQDLAHQSLRIYTSLDPELQRAASEAVEIGMKNVDEIVRKQHAKDTTPFNYPQVALIALNPHTGQVLALVGGRNYAASQLNHAVSKRPTGSIFKPFVYAAAFNSSLNGTALGEPGGVFTAVTHLSDTPTTFTFDHGRQTYNPNNFKGDFRGDVTAAYALQHSLNNATISLGQMVGFDNVAALARASGISGARGTPSVSLGAYDATPLDMSGAYTVFANGGVHLTPWMLASVRNTSGDIVADYAPEAKQVMDPRAAFLTQSLLESVMSYGTASVVRGRGFNAPAAGKTGTSHDAWFAGYTSNLICIVWVGNDDYTDVKIEGAHAAAPIWAEFMKRAIQLPQYSDVKSFSPPEGVTVAKVDRDSGLLTDAACPDHSMNVAFLDGTAPTGSCSQMNENPQSFFQKLFGLGGHAEQPADSPPASPVAPHAVPAGAPTDGATPPPQPEQPQKKKNIFQKIFGGGSGEKDKKQQPAQPAPAPQ